MSFEQDMAAEGEPEAEFDPGIAARLPSKRVAAGALLRDGQGRILMVEPIYKPTLEIPGGVVEADEPPLDACVREVWEELGLDLAVGRLLVVDWKPRHGVWGEIILFVFDGGVLTDDQIAGIKLQPDELRAVHRLAVTDIAGRVRPSMHRRIAQAEHAARSGETFYLQFGRRV
ncbi:NUDIX hydrolase [Catenulispora pinisilvae]|uniref:NUDIX hydrolase n=1 Tax=Catenulispora pinisilvae TaxID=2705253 RepID=UPI002B26589C|nr:NUDIX hydrolase [Catenulispora pinisilvae]